MLRAAFLYFYSENPEILPLRIGAQFFLIWNPRERLGFR